MKGLTKHRIRQIAQDFWSSTPVKYTTPCNLAHAAQSIFPISITSFPNLALEPVRFWFESRNIPLPVRHDGRKLRACLVAYEGMGMIFLDGTDSEHERRFSLAHELAHFILDYHLARQVAARVLGEGIAHVVDGKRYATIEERLDGILSGIDLGPFIHTMDRAKDGRIPTSAIQDSENMADLLALELAIPHKQVEIFMNDKWEEWDRSGEARQNISKEASLRYGIPAYFVHEHLGLAAIERSTAEPFTAWLRKER